jgi:hypothetical protein
MLFSLLTAAYAIDLDAAFADMALTIDTAAGSTIIDSGPSRLSSATLRARLQKIVDDVEAQGCTIDSYGAATFSRGTFSGITETDVFSGAYSDGSVSGVWNGNELGTILGQYADQKVIVDAGGADVIAAVFTRYRGANGLVMALSTTCEEAGTALNTWYPATDTTVLDRPASTNPCDSSTAELCIDYDFTGLVSTSEFGGLDDLDGQPLQMRLEADLGSACVNGELPGISTLSVTKFELSSTDPGADAVAELVESDFADAFSALLLNLSGDNWSIQIDQTATHMAWAATILSVAVPLPDPACQLSSTTVEVSPTLEVREGDGDFDRVTDTVDGPASVRLNVD